MKILFVFSSIGNLPPYEKVVTELCRNGHQVTILHGPTSKKYLTDHSLRKIQAEVGNRCKASPLLLRKKWRWLLALTRQLLNRTPYLDLRHPSPWLVNRNTGFSKYVQHILDLKPAVMFLRKEKTQGFLRWIENSIPADSRIRESLKQDPPDIVVGSPCIYAHQDEIEYIKAARELNISSVITIFSWDHLLTKGIIQIPPDWLMVWNEILKRDAEVLHRIPASSIFLTGAPHFDIWYQATPSLSYIEFCARTGLNPERKFVSYICSAVRGDETILVREFVNKLAEHPATHDLSVLVRPYPSKVSIWDHFRMENVVVWPKEGTIPDTPDTKDDYFHTMYHAVAVAGVSTTAFLEATVMDKPCITLMTEEYQYEHRMGHFQYLLKYDFLEIARNVYESAAIIEKILVGEDQRADRRREFIMQFARPWGNQYAASHIMAQAIEMVAKGQSLKQFLPQG